MGEGWVKLHRKLLDNRMLKYDHGALVVFVALLLLVRKNDGTYDTGRFRLAQIVGMNPSTIYKVLKRLEFSKMITINSNTRYSLITICNWSDYQQPSNTKSNNEVTTGEQRGNTKQEVTIKNKEVSSVGKDKFPIEQVKKIFDHYIECFDKNPNRYKLTSSRIKTIRSRLKGRGEEMLLEAIQKTSRSPHHRGENSSGWQADFDWIMKSEEQVERLANINTGAETMSITEAQKNMKEVL